MDGKNIPKIGSGQQKQPAEGGSKFPKLSKLPTAPSFTFPKKDPKANAQQKRAVAEIVSLDDDALDLDSTVKDVSRFIPADDEPTDVVSANEIMKAVAEMDAWDSIPAMNSVPSEIGSFSSIEMPKAASETPDVAKEVLTAEKTISAPMDEYEKQSEEVARGVLTAEATLSVPMNNYENKTSAASASKSRESKKVSRVAPPEPARAEKPAAPVQPPKSEPKTPAASASSNADDVEMSDEEKLQAMLDQMSPEERAEYEAYCAEQNKNELLRQREKQRELYEMYGNVSATGASNKAPIGLILVGVVICLGFLGLIIHFVTSDSGESEATNEPVAAEEPVKAEPIRAELKTYSVTINRGAADDVFVNGVLIDGSTAQFATGHRNTVLAYSSGMVPYFQTFDGKTDVTDPIDIQMVPDTLYAKGQISFRLTDREITNGGLRVTFDGHLISNFPGAISDVVLGYPHVLTLEKSGYAKHMHIIWGNDSNNTVTIPELKKEAEVISGTDCSLKKFPVSDKQYGVRIDTGGQSYSDPTTIATVPYGDIIEYYITREQRKPMQISVVPDGFGSMQMDVVLLHDSIGETVLAFETGKKAPDFQVCMRRVGVLICPDMKGETTVPSGNDWEFFAFQGEPENPKPIRGAQMQTLTANRKYVIEASKDERGLFKMNMKSATKVKDGKDSKK